MSEKKNGKPSLPKTGVRGAGKKASAKKSVCKGRKAEKRKDQRLGTERLASERTEVVTIFDMSEDGQGIGRTEEGLTLFVGGAVPGDRVRARITKEKKRYAFAETEEILTPSPDRIDSLCPYNDICGGCTMQELAPEAQHRLKEAQVRSKLERIAGLEAPTVRPLVTSPEEFRYRNKAEFAVRMESGEAVVGFMKRGSHEVFDCEDCLLQKRTTMAVAEAIRCLIDQGYLEIYDPKTKEGLLRSFTVKLCEGTGDLMLILTAAKPDLPNAQEIVDCVNDFVLEAQDDEEEFYLTSVVLEVKKKSLREYAEDYVVLAGERVITDEVNGLQFELAPASFYQVNTPQMVHLYEIAAQYAGLTGTETLLDLYCGVGTVGLSMVKQAGMVIGIEVVKEAILNANRNAVLNSVVNARYYAGKTEDILSRLFDPEDKIYASYLDPEAEIVAVLDPPRAGCEEAVLQTLADTGVSRIVYISCDPGTLARDVKRLTEMGYSFLEATPVEMFPWTGHIETVCFLSKLHSEQHIEVEVKMDELDLTLSRK